MPKRKKIESELHFFAPINQQEEEDLIPKELKNVNPRPATRKREKYGKNFIEVNKQNIHYTRLRTENGLKTLRTSSSSCADPISRSVIPGTIVEIINASRDDKI